MPFLALRVVVGIHIFHQGRLVSAEILVCVMHVARRRDSGERLEECDTRAALFRFRIRLLSALARNVRGAK